MLLSSHAVTSRTLLALVAVGACGGSKPAAPQPPAPAPEPGPGGATPPPAPVHEEPPPPITEAPHDPEFFAPAWKKVGVGQTIHFGVSVIDQDLDDTSVNVTKLPKTARFDALTQTVTWTPA